jgi:hypothetical protein
MQQLAHDVLERQYKEICSKWHQLNGFDRFDEFVETYKSSVGGSILPGVRNVVYRIDVKETFREGNVRWLAITSDAAEAIPTFPAVNGGPVYE